MKSPGRVAVSSHAARACVIFPGALGDFVCFLPALQVITRAAHVDLFAHSEFSGIVPPNVTVRGLESVEISQLFVRNAAQNSVLQNFFGAYSAVYSWMGGGLIEFVDQLQTLSNGCAKIFPFRPGGTTEHLADYYLRCLASLECQNCQPVIELRAEAMAWCENFWARHALNRQAVLALSPGSGAREKNWSEEFFLEVVDWWRESTGGTVVLLIGPVEAERGGVDRLRQSCVVANELSLSQVAAILGRSDIYLGNDSGISHLAAALGTRTVVIFGPSDARQWAPRGKKVTVVSRRIDCSPCSVSTMKSCPHRACLTELFPETIVQTIAALPELSTLTRGGVGIRV